MKVKLSDAEFRVLLDLFMVSDPWPLEASGNETIRQLLDEESSARSYENWVVAYHEHQKKEQTLEGGQDESTSKL